ncbi:GNAT family N-acetyltransferase [Parasedimentitalea huanghaiensis]|uniref:GNAT family N-acetyltransferase n=1 Tax=Parasedimentitalea huanghaiensis TaxID=2682100 RepID=A0A6L6WEY0_9RHOB|nr:GNAT family N-acetyltransferase [Zongyanglinia huanghaiensis]MVO16030.1 GNAT family N-acetyltransferase [Zongyanglinia huanghaiensis]
MVQIPHLQTERLLLRAPNESDFDAYAEFFGDGDASHFYGGPIGPLAAWGRLARDSGHWLLRGYGQWTIVHRNSGDVIGSAGFAWPTGWPRPELTWWIGPHWRRKGIAREASVAAIGYGYDELKWGLVQTHMNDENTAAKSLVVSLGGHKIAREAFPDGISRDIYCLPRPPSS